MLSIAICIGFITSFLGVRIVVFIYRYKGTPYATMVRIVGVSFGAIIVSFSHYLLRYVFWDGTSLELDVATAFTVSIILSMTFFFWLYRKKIG